MNYQCCKKPLTQGASGQTNSGTNSTMLIGQEIIAFSTNFVTIYYIPWMVDVYRDIKQAYLFFEAIILNSPLEIQIVNATNNNIVLTQKVSGSGFHKLLFNPPQTNARLVLRVRKTNSGSNPRTYGIGMVV